MEEEIRIALEKQNPWWFGKKVDSGVPRLLYYPELQKYLKTQEILLILGARRTGKSTLLYQLIGSLSTDVKSILFINLDEPLFQSRADDPSFLREIIERYIHQQKGLKRFYIFIDEVQNYDYGVSTLKTLHDTDKSLKFIVTGSTSKLLKSRASRKLSGRYFNIVVYPLTFKEYLAFTGAAKLSTIEKKEEFANYLKYGAFPRVVLEKDEDLKREILKNYFQTIYLKDIVYPLKVRNNKDVFDLLYFAISNVSKPFSYTRMAKEIGIDKDTVKEYLTYAEDAYLLFSINKYDHSVRKQLANPKKIYCIDTGLVNSLSFRFSENRGRLLENLVFLILKRKHYDIYYHKADFECDFLVKSGLKIKKAIQVTLSIKDEAVRKREIRGVMEAMKAHNLREGMILTESEKECIKIDGKTIYVEPVYVWAETQS